MDDRTKVVFVKFIRDGGFLLNYAAMQNTPDLELLNNELDQDPEFRKAYEASCRSRADVLFEQALITAANTSKANVGPNKVFIDTMKWGAQVSNPEKYNGKGIVSEHGDGIIILDTGIREDDNGGNEEGRGSESSEGERQKDDERGDGQSESSPRSVPA